MRTTRRRAEDAVSPTDRPVVALLATLLPGQTRAGGRDGTEAETIR